MIITRIIFELKVLIVSYILRRKLNEKIHFCRYYFQFFSKDNKSMRHIKIFLKINGK